MIRIVLAPLHVRNVGGDDRGDEHGAAVLADAGHASIEHGRQTWRQTRGRVPGFDSAAVPVTAHREGMAHGPPRGAHSCPSDLALRWNGAATSRFQRATKAFFADTARTEVSLPAR